MSRRRDPRQTRYCVACGRMIVPSRRQSAALHAARIYCGRQCSEAVGRGVQAARQLLAYPPEVGRVIDAWRAMYRSGLIQFHDVRGVGERHAVVPAVLYCELATAVLALESAIGAAFEDDAEGEA